MDAEVRLCQETKPRTTIDKVHIAIKSVCHLIKLTLKAQQAPIYLIIMITFNWFNHNKQVHSEIIYWF